MASHLRRRRPALTATIREGQAKIFSRGPGDAGTPAGRTSSRVPERPLLKLNIDAGGVRSRMLIEQAIATERLSSAKPA
jgi:vanillate O-demethylase monooxygenase subunit